MRRFFTAVAILFFGLNANAQQGVLGCIDRDMRVQAEELKGSFVKQGLVVAKDAMLNMETQSPIPVIMPMAKGKIYQLILIGNKNASKVTLEIMDGSHKRIALKQTSKGGNNYIVYSFIPPANDDYIMMISQKFRGRSSCGSFTIMEEPQKEAPSAK